MSRRRFTVEHIIETPPEVDAGVSRGLKVGGKFAEMLGLRNKRTTVGSVGMAG